MKTLIIITLLLLVLTIVLIVLIAKKFLDKTDYILASNAIVSSNITDNANKILNLLDTIERLQQDNYNKTINHISDEHKSIRTALTNTISAIGDANKNIIDSIGRIEEKNNIIVKMLDEITKFNEHHRRVTEMLDNKIIEAQLKRKNISDAVYNISDSIRIIKQNIEGSEGTKVKIQKITNKLIEVSNEIITNNELLKEVRNEIKAKNSLSDTQTKKPLLHKAKTNRKLKTAIKQDNSQQERIDEIAKQQNK